MQLTSAELPLDKSQKTIEEVALKLAGRPRHCIKNAFRRLRQAWRLRETDTELAVFCAITAEEEAATALMFALKERGYKGSKKLKTQSHPHKSAVIHTITAIKILMHELKFPDMECAISLKDDKPRIDVNIDLRGLNLPQGEYGQPDEPLNMNVSVTGPNGEAVMLEDQFKKIAADKNMESFEEFIRHEANVRNEALYATEEGIPHMSVEEKFFPAYINRIIAITMITMAVMQVRGPLPLAQAALDAYFVAMEKLTGRMPELDNFLPRKS